MALHISLALFVVSLIDIFTSDIIRDANDRAVKQETNIFSFIVGFFFKILLVLNNMSEKLLIHDYNYFVFFFTLVLLPTLMYAIKVSLTLHSIPKSNA